MLNIIFVAELISLIIEARDSLVADTVTVVDTNGVSTARTCNKSTSKFVSKLLIFQNFLSKSNDKLKK